MYRSLRPRSTRPTRGPGAGAPLANDTSFSVVSLPRSPLEAAVRLLSRIGRPVDRPVTVDVELRTDEASSGSSGTDPILKEREVRSIVEAALADWCGTSRRLIEGRYELV